MPYIALHRPWEHWVVGVSRGGGQLTPHFFDWGHGMLFDLSVFMHKSSFTVQFVNFASSHVHSGM